MDPILLSTAGFPYVYTCVCKSAWTYLCMLISIIKVLLIKDVTLGLQPVNQRITPDTYINKLKTI